MESSKLKKEFTLTQWFQVLSILAALIIIIDFIIPSKVYTDPILNIKKERQQYYNAAGNSHSSYKVFTEREDFNVSGSFAKQIKGVEKITYSISPFFNEVNYYSLIDSEKRNVYSLRLVSGLALPLITILVLLLAIRYKKRVEILSFVFQVLIIADFIYLLL